eukprot:bmy_07424T0
MVNLLRTKTKEGQQRKASVGLQQRARICLEVQSEKFLHAAWRLTVDIQKDIQPPKQQTGCNQMQSMWIQNNVKEKD